MESKYENMKIIYNRSKFGWYWAPLFVAFWFLLFYLVVIPNFHRFPETMTLKQEAMNPGRFIGERAESTLLRLTKIGPKVVGSPANEQAAIQFMLAEIKRIKESARYEFFEIEQDVQISSGNYVLWDMVNTYQSIQNVLVRVTPRRSASTATLLLNTHYDTVPGSSGAGDAGMMVAVMLETLRVLVTHETPLTHKIVFLFNGAEENPLQGSHAFITQHAWAKDVRAVINLDSAGSGGREILFQSGPDHPWIMNYYSANIVHPYASTVAEELFQNGFVPSETDFRIFRDFGHVPGLDMAHTLNGYVYHTKYDRFNLIPRKSYQLTGDNILALTKALANAPELEDPDKYAEGHTVFYDVLGWFMVYYSESTGIIINSCVCVLAIVSILAYIWNMAHQTGMFRRRIFAKFGILLGVQFGAVVAAVLATILVGVFVDAVGMSMSWFSQPWMVFGLYFCPMFFVLGIIPAFYFSRTKEHGLPVGYVIQLTMHAHCLILTVVTVIMIAIGIRSAFLVVIAIGFYTLSVVINILTCSHKKAFVWLIPHILCQICPFIFYTYFCYAFYVTFIPMQGRDGANTNPELMIGGCTAIMCLLFAAFLVPLFCIFRKSKTIISIFGVICVIFIILAATPVGFPYVEKSAPQRFYAVHTARQFNDGNGVRSDSGYFVMPVDRRPHSIDYMFENSNLSKSSHENCNTALMCGYPIYSKRWLATRDQSFWVAGPAPKLNNWPKLKVLSRRSSSPSSIIFTMELSGPDHMSLFIQPLANVKLVDWSFGRDPLKSKKGPPYFLYFSYALDPSPFRFNLEFEFDDMIVKIWSGPLFDAAIIGHRIHDDISNTNAFREFLASFPPWAHVSGWTGSYGSLRF